MQIDELRGRGSPFHPAHTHPLNVVDVVMRAPGTDFHCQPPHPPARPVEPLPKAAEIEWLLSQRNPEKMCPLLLSCAVQAGSKLAAGTESASSHSRAMHAKSVPASD
jgi:hypothetical protein